MKTFLIGLVAATYMISNGCKIKGCTDKNAYNWESDANKDDRSCKYSRLEFYTTDTVYTNSLGVLEDIDYIEVRVDGNYLGQAPFTPTAIECTGLEFDLEDGEPHEWLASIVLTTDTVQIQGTVEATHDVQCIGIDVTP